MLKKSCPYHKTPVNHTLEQCDMLKKFYGRAAAKDAEAKKDGGDGDAGGFPAVENIFLIFRGPTVDPIIGNTRFSKVLMDGGSSLNILYAHTLRLLGIGLDQLQPSTTPFHGVAPGKRVQPLGQIDLPVWFSTAKNFRKETLTFEVVGFKGTYHAILGRRAGHSIFTEPIGSVLRYSGKFGSSEIGTDRFLQKLGTEGVRYR
jgi:hypothetical protein